MLEFQMDAEAVGGAMPHFWEKCVGSCHAYTALREDWRRQLTKVHREMGFEYVRFHGLFDDDMSVLTIDPWTKKIRYCFVNIDSIFDFLLKIGMKPFLELSFMPDALASGEKTCFHYRANITMPKNIDDWDQFIECFTRHLVDRYGLAEVRSWFFEVWNEPNLSYFFDGTQADYFKLYEHTARSIKTVDGMLAVGGPATAINDWIPEFITFCRENRVPLDFITTHHYPTDDPLWDTDNPRLKGKLESANSDGHMNYERGILKKMALKSRQEAGSFPLYYTEWNSSAHLPDKIHDYPYTAAFAAKSILDNIGIVDGYSYWTFTDIFEEQAQIPGEFHGGFGMQTIHGIPKPVYHTFEFLHQLGTERVPITPEQETVGFVATRKGNGYRLVGYNYNIPEDGISSQPVRIVVKNKPCKMVKATLVDSKHGNTCQKWAEMGSPVYPNDSELEQLSQASATPSETLPFSQNGNDSVIEFTLAPDAVILLDIE